ncbi:MAG: sulfur carrier protein ThiS adenylyltransferase ThiF [Desulfobacteraceae bacterium]
MKKNKTRIGIAGLGGIGSMVAQLLVRCRVEALTLVDFDRVEPSNLNRQFYFYDQIGKKKTRMLARNLERLNPRVRVDLCCERLDSENIVSLFRKCAVVVEGVDDKAVKKQVVEAFAGTATPVVSASGIAGDDMTGIRVKTMGNVTIVGDFVTDEADTALFPPKVHMTAALMVREILKFLYESRQPSAVSHQPSVISFQ